MTTDIQFVETHDLRAVVQHRDNVQQQRIRCGNRIDAVMRGTDQVSEEILNYLRARFETYQRLERDDDDLIASIIEPMNITAPLLSVKGIGPSYVGQIISSVDITLVGTVSAMWKWCGLGVTDGVADRRVKGQKIHYNPFLKTVLLEKVGSSFPKARSPYSAIYYEWKDQYTERNNSLPKEDQRTAKHIHNMARRKMVKMFVSHLWQVWREIEGLPTPDPYAHAHLGHVDIITPEEMGWQY